MMPMVSLGKGFMSSRVRSSGAHVHSVNVSNGMPAVVHNKNLIKKNKKHSILCKNNMVNGDLAAKGD